MEEFRVVWNVGRGPQTMERVDGPGAGAKLIAERERSEGRRLADEEYGLLVVTRGGNANSIALWRDESGATIHAYVPAERPPPGNGG